MERLVIKNGLVFDPLNNIEGEKKDILIESGKIVEKFSTFTDIKEIDANGKTVIPAASDIHTHVASQQVNWARLLGANVDMFKETWKGLTLGKIAKDYIKMGYTFILEANVFPSLAKQTIFNFKQLPVLDKAMLLNISNFWPLELEFQRGKIEEMAIFLSDLLSKTYGFGFKLYNPFENESWNFKELRDGLSNQGRLYNFSALNVYESVVRSVESLGLPHSAHAHIEGYEDEISNVNLFDVLDKISSLNLQSDQKTNLNSERSQILHLAHANAYSANGDNKKILNLLNENHNFDIDVAFIGFDPINPLISSDRRLINSIANLENPYKLISSAVEFEGDSFVSLRTFEKSNFNACTLWGNALDLSINIKDKLQLSFSLNYPNYANVLDIPEIATWLLSKDARDNFMKGMNNNFITNHPLSNEEKSLSFSEFVTITRASPAKSLGLGKIKGNLGIGADADINILDINIDNVDISKSYETLKIALQSLDYVIKAGEIVKNYNKIDLSLNGLIFWSSGKPNTEKKESVLSKKRDFYQKYSSMFYDSLKCSVEAHILRKID
ncbi:hypothetical protein LCGC14_1378220 [marine sediment metagenome]|uniref:Amidohydrolase 3 domain-containing protein n=1 Tax=marine sediment metagenome TaxID=412755 RepID=A0A0F9K3T3_9ZZZZ